MVVTVNGERRELSIGSSVVTLLEQFKLTPEKVAVELNRRLIRADKYVLPLKEGDEIEIVTFVGGG